jgi:uncharacterized membrane protein
LVVAIFQEEDMCHEALKQLEVMQREGRLSIQAAALIGKNERGKIQIRETAGMGSSRGAVLGGTTGAAVGFIAGSALEAPPAVRALVGALAARLRGSCFLGSRLEALEAGLEPGSAVLVAAVEYMWGEAVLKRMAEAGAAVITAYLQADLAAQLEAGHDVAYAALTSVDRFQAARDASTKHARGRATALRGDTAYGARFVGTPKGLAVVPIADEGSSAFADALFRVVAVSADVETR